MFGTASSSKHASLRALNVSPIDYKTEGFVRFVKKEYRMGIDAAFDAIGGRNLRRSVAAVKRGGVVVSYGFSGSNYGGYWELAKGIMQFIYLNLLPNRKKVIGCGTPGESMKDPDWYRDTLSKIFKQIASGELDPLIDGTFPLRSAQKAHARIQSRSNQGKVLLVTEAYKQYFGANNAYD